MMRKDLNWVFDRCLEKLQAGTPLEAVLAEYPDWADELRPVLESVMALWQARGSDTVPVAAMTRSRARLNEEIQRRQAVQPTLSLWQRFFQSMRRVTVPAVILLVATGLSLTGLASVKALPGEPLYPMKIAAERISLNLPANASERLTREETYDTRRFEEVEELRHQQREQEVYFTGDLALGEDGVWRIGQIPLDVPASMEEELAKLEGRYIIVHADLMPDGNLVLEWFELRLYTISGRVQEVDGARMRIDTVWADLSADAAGQWTPAVGQRVTASVVRLAGGGLMVVKLTPGEELNEPVVQVPPTEQPQEQENNSQPEPSATAEPTKHEDEKDKSGDKEHAPTLTATDLSTPEPTRKEGDDDEHKTKTPEPTLEPSPTRTPD